MGMQTPSLGQTAISEGTDRSTETAGVLGMVVGRDEERVLPRVGAQRSRVPLWPLRLLRGARGLSVEVSTRAERRSLTSVLNPPPHQRAPLLSPLRIAAHRTGAVAWVLGKGKEACPARLVGAAARAVVPAGSEAGRWAREGVRCLEWDVWLRNLRACLPAGVVAAVPHPILGLGGGGG